MTILLTCVLVFALTAITDVFWTTYIQYAAEKRAVAASFASAAIVAVGSITTIVYVEDHRIVPAAVLGAFVGTFLAVKRSK